MWRKIDNVQITKRKFKLQSRYHRRLSLSHRRLSTFARIRIVLSARSQRTLRALTLHRSWSWPCWTNIVQNREARKHLKMSSNSVWYFRRRLFAIRSAPSFIWSTAGRRDFDTRAQEKDIIFHKRLINGTVGEEEKTTRTAAVFAVRASTANARWKGFVSCVCVFAPPFYIKINSQNYL